MPSPGLIDASQTHNVMRMVEHPARKRRGKGDTRERIIRNAARLFATHGYAATSIDAICEASGVVPSSVYWEFGNKASVLQAALEDSAQRWRNSSTKGVIRAIRERAESDDDRLGAYFDYMAGVFTKDPEFPRLMIMAALERRHKDMRALEIIRSYRVEWVTEVSRLLAQLGLEGAGPEDPTAHEITDLTFACFDGGFISAQVDPDPARLRAMFSLLHSALRALLRPPRE
jgi:AcrR family transcriptional regulator